MALTYGLKASANCIVSFFHFMKIPLTHLIQCMHQTLRIASQLRVMLVQGHQTMYNNHHEILDLRSTKVIWLGSAF